jgi:uncharacterized protein YfaS (alpha-2-macroglobulin family)
VISSRLRPRDAIEAAALVHNLSGQDGNVDFSVEALGDASVLRNTDKRPGQVFLHVDEKRMVRVRVLARRGGQARVRWRARLHGSDGAEHQDTVELPVTVRADEPIPQVTAIEGRVPAGEIFAIDVSLWSEHPQEHVAVEIPLAAGLEPYDPSMGNRGRALAPNLAPARQLDVAAQEYHADRIRLFLHRLPAGAFRTHSVYVRAAVPGQYLMPAASVQAMCAPHINGRTAARHISIVAPSEENP